MNVLRDCRAASLHHMQMWIAEWGHTSGPDHDDARREARAAIQRYRTQFLEPERARAELFRAGTRADELKRLTEDYWP